MKAIPATVRAEGCSNGDGIVSGGTYPFTNAKIDDNVFDHGGVTPVDGISEAAKALFLWRIHASISAERTSNRI
jgi:hypothetical protein